MPVGPDLASGRLTGLLSQKGLSTLVGQFCGGLLEASAQCPLTTANARPVFWTISKPKWCSGSALSSPLLPSGWGGSFTLHCCPLWVSCRFMCLSPSSLPALTYNLQWKSMETRSNQSVGNNNEVILGWDERHFKWGQGFKLLTRE